MSEDRTILNLRSQAPAPLLVSQPTPPSRPDRVADDILQELQEAITTAPQESLPADLTAVRVDPFERWGELSATTSGPTRFFPDEPPRRRFRVPTWRGLFSLTPWLIGAGIVVAGLLYVSENGFRIKSRVVQQGNAAIASLVSARDDLERMDLAAAQQSFTSAAENFQAAQDQLGTVGSWLLKLIGTLPGASSARAAQDLITAGKAISDAGLAISQAVDALSHTGTLLDSGAPASPLEPLSAVLTRSADDLILAQKLLKGVDASVVPEDSREQFIAFRDHIPQVQELIQRGTDMVAFLQRLTGTDRPQRYLVLFENSSELRPTGGFPGSYGILTFEHGRVKDFRADDIYNPDGQIRELVVPPQQLQHITPSWGMRDAAWFVDFSTSAKKVMAFWKLGGGSAVDGVIAINDAVLSDILKVIGPITLPTYDLTLDKNTALAQLQQEVEYGINKQAGNPKQVIVDLAPQLLKQIATAGSSQWLELLSLLHGAFQRRDILMYFPDASLQEYTIKNGWDGAVRDTVGDYLQVNVANVKGAKADAVTDNAMKLESWLEDGTMVHRLTLTRRHDGGTSPFGFYNKTNYSWVRVLVPEGSTLRGVSGNDRTAYRPLVNNYTTATHDPDLAILESTYRTDATRDVTTFTESGKTGFGFWMSVAPGHTSQVQIEYTVPARAVASDYHLTVQRQPGMEISNFEFTLQKTSGIQIGQTTAALVEWPDSWRFHDDLDRDVELTIPIRQ